MEKMAAENPIPMYWVRPQQNPVRGKRYASVCLGHALSATRGAEREFPIPPLCTTRPSSLLAQWAMPGNYTSS